MRQPSAPLHPPPLPAGRLPLAVRWRALAWRLRLPFAAACVAGAVLAGLHALAPPPPRTLPLVVAARDVPAGVALTTGDLRLRRVPADVVPRGAPTTVAGIVGSSTAVPLAAGTPLVPGVLASRDVAGPPGTVVAVVRFADPAVAQLLPPGSRVDVVAADPDGARDGASDDPGPSRGRIVATHALVLPAPATSEHGDAAGFGLLGGSTTQTPTPPVLLAVSPDEATALAGASASSVLAAVVVP